MTLAVATRLGPYQIEALLGAGGMGEVYRARDSVLRRTVAIKVLAALADDEVARGSLLHEARAASALNHPHICTIHEVGDALGQPYIVMEHVTGRTLAQLLAAGALAPDDVVRYGAQMADALAHAHERGIIHGDLKAANVVVTPDGRVKVLDFGHREMKDVFAIQDDIARAVVETLKVKLLEPERLLVKRGTEDLEAYDLYLKGRYGWNKWTTDGAQEGAACFQQAIATDPHYAAAHAGLAECYATLGHGAPRQASSGNEPERPRRRRWNSTTRLLRLGDECKVA